MAVMQAGKPEVLENAEGNRTTPSVVAAKDDNRLVGTPAKKSGDDQSGKYYFFRKKIHRAAIRRSRERDFGNAFRNRERRER